MAEKRHNPGAEISIMCTLTGAQILEKGELVRQLHDAGMRAVRINTAHLETTGELCTLATRLKTLLPDVKILIDTKGPEIRTTSVAEASGVSLTEGMPVTICGTSDDTYTTADIIHVNYPQLSETVSDGDTILIDDGKITLRAERIEGVKISAIVTHGGVLGSRKGLTVQGVDVPLPAVSQRDRNFIEYAATSPLVDEVAHSFVRSAADVQAVRQAMRGASKPIVAKIENQQGLDNLDEIMKFADAILIARGDLTASIGAEAVPQVQRAIAAAAKAAGKPLYLATNILASLMHDTIVSEADRRGVHTAMAQGVDVFLLTNETASGENPLLAVRTLGNIITE